MHDEPVLKTFDEDLEGLTRIQKTFISPDAKFIYFRKGEAQNNVPITAAIIGVIVVVYGVVKDYPVLKEGVKAMIKDIKAMGRVLLAYVQQPLTKPGIREIACPDDPEITVTLEILRSLGGDVRYLPRDRRGKFRFFVNSKEYCLFVRRNDERFSGVIGNDPNMIGALKETFEAEWEELTPLQGSLISQIPGIAEAQNWANE